MVTHSSTKSAVLCRCLILIRPLTLKSMPPTSHPLMLMFSLMCSPSGGPRCVVSHAQDPPVGWVHVDIVETRTPGFCHIPMHSPHSLGGTWFRWVACSFHLLSVVPPPSMSCGLVLST